MEVTWIDLSSYDQPDIMMIEDRHGMSGWPKTITAPSIELADRSRRPSD